MTTLPFRRTHKTVVDRMRGRVSEDCDAFDWGLNFCPVLKEAPGPADSEDERFTMFYSSIAQRLQAAVPRAGTAHLTVAIRPRFQRHRQPELLLLRIIRRGGTALFILEYPASILAVKSARLLSARASQA
ncbi:hypothetical protein ACPOL_1282 [Acidisarcina polymorpha]|uniref:Uncharacterized protein n=1 Tax=Acidisarcina polymorpha TaxID=2211140 RepID=A0A2Z5FV55_9BACT|nr:hypothetical protein ACPOL_1282 [Acidisarcina polymorpha]